MNLTDTVLLGLLQVLGELWPLDSTGQIALIFPVDAVPTAAKLVVLIATQIGVLLALLIILHREFATIAQGLWKMLKGKSAPELGLFGKMIVASLPAIAGLALGMFFAVEFSFQIIAWVMGGTAILLLLADLMGVTVRRLEHLDWNSTGLFALAQCLALIPGASRVGLMMTVARFSGYERPDAVRLSYLLSFVFWLALIPLEFWFLWDFEPLTLSVERLQIAGVALVVGLIAGYGLLLWVRHHTVWPFVLWRLGVAGLALFALL